MQFALLVLFNVFLCAVFYLIISLKLERSATEYRERRLRKEMDEIISEFNRTAERNISLLESRIHTMRRLLEKAGQMKGIDVTIDDEAAAGTPRRSESINQSRIEKEREESGPHLEWKSSGETLTIKKGLQILTAHISSIFFRKRERAVSMNEVHRDDGTHEAAAIRASFIDSTATGSIIQREAGSAPRDDRVDEVIRRAPMSDEEFKAIVEQAENRYALVALLHERGCSPEEIACRAGIPLGEVRLVMNLNNSR